MGLEKAIEHGHEHRKAYIGAKAIDKTCRNHGGCDWCRQNRQFQETRKKEALKQQEDEYDRGEL